MPPTAFSTSVGAMASLATLADLSAGLALAAFLTSAMAAVPNCISVRDCASAALSEGRSPRSDNGEQRRGRASLMPIRRQHRWLHPIDWRELSVSVRLRRAKGQCEGCGRPHGRTVIHLGDGRWWDDERQAWRWGKGRVVRRRPQPADHGPSGRSTRVVLASAHLGHDPFNNGADNLAALCQRCHILHDKHEHLRRWRLTYLARRALGDLFTGPYPTA